MELKVKEESEVSRIPLLLYKNSFANVAKTKQLISPIIVETVSKSV